jgi:drug/metabolite transporter (DMT)-like permease
MTPSRRTATFSGLIAVLLWSTLAALTARSGAVPPFQLATMSFGIAGVIGCVILVLRGETQVLRQPAIAWALGVGGLAGYHALYFAALRTAPPLEASLVAYSWPLLIVLLSATLPGERLSQRHFIGAILGFVGAISVITGGAAGSGITANAVTGYALAFAAAGVWAGFSVLSRRLAHVPPGAMAGFCLATAAVSAALHLPFEATVWPDSGAAWLAVLLLGLGPVGTAFFFWDIGVKRGDIQFLGTASYAAPLLSSLLLILLGEGRLTAAFALGACLIVAGALAASPRYARRHPSVAANGHMGPGAPRHLGSDII